MNFTEWIDFESKRILQMGALAPEEHRTDYILVQIRAALKKHISMAEMALPNTIHRALYNSDVAI